MPIDELIRAALLEAARAKPFPETRDGQKIITQKEGKHECIPHPLSFVLGEERPPKGQ